MIYYFALIFFVLVQTHSHEIHGESEYGVDHSYPIHHYIDKKASPRYAKFYDEKMEGCYALFSKRECDATERARLEMNMAQPAAQHNYTELGFKKLKLPPHVWQPLIEFYEQNKNNQHLETWPRGYTYVNTWESPSYMISLEDRSLRGGLVVKQQIWDGVQPIIEEWVGKKVTPTSLYGIRVYRDKAILATHVDRLPLVSSCIINVAQDVNEPWPIEVYDHSGRAHNVTMEPGDMVLYESHTVLHGRPFPLNGNLFANVFVHYQPIDHDDTQRRELEQRNLERSKQQQNSLFSNPFAAKAVKRKIGGHEQDQHDLDEIKKHLEQIDHEDKHPVVKAADSKITMDSLLKPLHKGAKAVKDIADQLLAESPEHQLLDSNAKQFAFDEKLYDKPELLRRTAARGDYAGLVKILKGSSAKEANELLQSHDENGWQAIHEAVRSGSVDAVRLLVDSGADLGTKIDGGGAALWVAQNTLEDGHEVTEYLVSIGAPEVVVDEEDEE